MICSSANSRSCLTNQGARGVSGETIEPKDPSRLSSTSATLRIHVPRQGSFQEGENSHSDSPQGGEQVPDGVLQPAEVQHGRAETTEEAEDQESHPLISVA